MWLTRPLQERSTQIFLGVLFSAVVLVTFLHLFMPQDIALIAVGEIGRAHV